MGVWAVPALVLLGGGEGGTLGLGELVPEGPRLRLAPALLQLVAPQEGLAVGRRLGGEGFGGVLVRWPCRKWLDGLDLRGPGFVRGGSFGERGVELLLSGQGLLVVRQQTLDPRPLQAHEAVQRPADLALRLAPVAQDQRQAGAGVLVVVQGLGEAGAGLREAGQQLAFQALGPARAEDAGGDGLGEVAGDRAYGSELGPDGGEVGLVGLRCFAQGRDGDVGTGAQAVGEAVHRGAAFAVLGDRAVRPGAVLAGDVGAGGFGAAGGHGRLRGGGGIVP